MISNSGISRQRPIGYKLLQMYAKEIVFVSSWGYWFHFAHAVSTKNVFDHSVPVKNVMHVNSWMRNKKVHMQQACRNKKKWNVNYENREKCIFMHHIIERVVAVKGTMLHAKKKQEERCNSNGFCFYPKKSCVRTISKLMLPRQWGTFICAYFVFLQMRRETPSLRRFTF